MLKKWGGIGIFILNVTLVYGAALNAPAPGFHLLDSQHKKRSLADYKGDVVFINFWASWCAPCQRELPEINRLAADYRAKKVKVLAINVDASRADAEKLLGRLGLASAEVTILWDSASHVVSAYNIESMPSSFVLDRRGIIRYTHSGFRTQDSATWRQEIDQLLSKKK